MPRGPTSCASVRTSDSIAAFDAAYALSRGVDVRDAIELVAMIDDPLLMCGNTACVICSVPITLTL